MANIRVIPTPVQQVAQDPSHLDASSRIMFLAAAKLGISCTIMPDFQTILMTKNGVTWYTRGSRTSTQSAIGQTITSNKATAKEFLQAYQIPTAKAIKVTKESDMEKLQTLNWPLVMKPTSGAHGKDVIVGLNDLNTADSVWNAHRQSVLFEETLQGIEYRIVCVNYVFTAAAFRKPAFVTGDGAQTIAQLIEQTNRQPGRVEGHRGNLSKIMVDEELQRVLNLQQLNLDSVPEFGKEITLRKTANLSTGGEAENVTKSVCLENRELFEKIARICDLNVLGIDVMCQSLATPILNQTHAGVIEINKSPGLRMHHFPSVGEPIDVATQILNSAMIELGV